ncbi:MAG TPA: stage II sporulation protein P [Clostridiales bacterium]|nr:stage II sporulation protein P [Clostridiales bacterium]
MEGIAKRVLAVFIITALIITAIKSNAFNSFFDTAKDAAVFSALLAMPEGYYQNIRKMAGATVSADDTIYNPEPENIPEDDILQSEPETSTAPLPEEAVGRIISRFVSPYSVKLAYNNVYVRNLTSKEIDLKSELEAGPALRLNSTNEPQVLIIHTHTTEGFMLEDRDYYTNLDESRTTDMTKNIVHIGEIIKNQIEAAGISVIHDVTLHDYPSYSGSYSRSEKTVRQYLEKYPSIKVVLDIHRDAISAGGTDKVKPVKEINGKKAAQIMLVLGCEDGNVTGFPNWRENLRLGLKVQQLCEVKYPGLARAIHFAPKKYNQHLSTGSMIIEVGTDANTLEEAIYSGQLIGKVLGSVLNTLKQ